MTTTRQSHFEWLMERNRERWEPVDLPCDSTRDYIKFPPTLESLFPDIIPISMLRGDPLQDYLPRTQEEVDALSPEARRALEAGAAFKRLSCPVPIGYAKMTT